MVRANARQLVVLVVDDDPGDVVLIEDALERTGLVRAVHVAGDGREAVAFLRRTGTHVRAPRPELVLLDLNMPRMNGREVLEQIKSDPHLGAIPVVVFTTSQDPDDIATSYARHANAYVTKPINLDHFTVVMAQISQFFAEVVALPTAS